MEWCKNNNRKITTWIPQEGIEQNKLFDFATRWGSNKFLFVANTSFEVVIDFYNNISTPVTVRCSNMFLSFDQEEVDNNIVSDSEGQNRMPIMYLYNKKDTIDLEIDKADGVSMQKSK